MYQVELFYGYEDNDQGIYHAFLAENPDEQCVDEIADKLAEMLDLDADDENFNWDSMYINLPDLVVQKIKDDAVRQYLAGIKD